MIELLFWLASHPVLSFFVVLLQFFIVMKIHHKAHNKILHYIMAAWFIPQDVVVNLVAISIIGLELPQEWLVTTRMKRWKKLNGQVKPIEKWRWLFSVKLCDILNKADAGHC